MNKRYYTEPQIVKRSMIVLSLSLILVYIVFYYVKSDLLGQDLDIVVNTTGVVMISELENTDDIFVNNDSGSKQTSVDDDSKEIKQNTNYIDGLDTDSILILSGTKTYYGEIDFVEKLGISYQYALIDDKNIYYLNMGKYDYDFSDIVRKLGGNLYVMNTEQELISNSMFGDKVTYINIPDYKNKKVMLLLDISNQLWLLAIDYDIYHHVKPYLKTLFID